MLPDGFSWTRRHQYDDRDSALVVGGHQVAMLLQRLNGTWFARLDAHQPITAPLITRSCTSFETGRAGIEAWACRHEERLRREVER